MEDEIIEILLDKRWPQMSFGKIAEEKKLIKNQKIARCDLEELK
jgi:hypothetical protein